MWLTEDFASTLQSLSDQSTLRDQLTKAVASTRVPVVHDNSAVRHALSLENSLGGPEAMANQVGATAHASLLAAQILCLRDTKPEVWAKTSRIAVASSFISSILTGKVTPFYESEAAGTGLYSVSKEQWEDKVLSVVSGSDGPARLKSALGSVERSTVSPIGQIASYFTAKYGLDSGAYI